MPYAARGPEVSWAASRATAANSTPAAASPIPSAHESAAARGTDTRLSATSTPVARLARTATRNAAAVVALRPIAAERSTSSRPVSSSVRVWRTTRNIDISPAVTAPNAVDCQATCPPTVLSARAGPAMAMNAALPSIAAAAASNSACVAYSSFTLIACDQ